MSISGMKKDFYNHVKSAVGGRLYPGKLPTEVILPAGRYTVVDGPPEGRTHDEEGTSAATVRMQVTVWAETAPAAQEAAEAINAVAESFRGGDNSEVHDTYRADINDMEDPDTKWVQINQDYLISLYLTKEETI